MFVRNVLLKSLKQNMKVWVFQRCF